VQPAAAILTQSTVASSVDLSPPHLQSKPAPRPSTSRLSQTQPAVARTLSEFDRIDDTFLNAGTSVRSLDVFTRLVIESKTPAAFTVQHHQPITRTTPAER
jgi:hypothetical protein